MKQFLKYIGIILILIGVGVFYAYAKSLQPSNTLLITGLCFVIGGFFAHLFLNRYVH